MTPAPITALGMALRLKNVGDVGAVPQATAPVLKELEAPESDSVTKF